MKQKSSEDNQNKPTHDSRYVYKEETLDSRYQVKRTDLRWSTHRKTIDNLDSHYEDIKKKLMALLT